MLTKQLKALIDTSLAAGRQMNDIREILKKQGFLESAIDELFSEYRQGEKGAYADEVHSGAEQMEQTILSSQSVPLKPDPVEQTPLASSVQQTPTAQSTPPFNNNLLQRQPDSTPEPVAEEKTYQPHGSIQVGLGDIPELRNAAVNAYESKRNKSVIPFIIAIFLILALMGGFAFWYLYIKDGGVAGQNLQINFGKNSATEQTAEEVVEPGTIDPFTGERFK